jgi:hypothetical protein
MLEELLHKYGVKTDIEWTAKNPHMANFDANHYKITFHIKDEDGSRQMTTYYSMGKALTDKPTATTVIDTLMQDMQSITDGLDDFIANMGYEYQEGKKVFDTIETQTQKMFNFFGFDKFRELRDLYENEEI